MAAPKRRNGRDNLEAEVRLLAMSKDDSSWSPCEISLCSDRVGLNVQYMINGSIDVFFTKEEALARLLIRSSPLQGAECTLIEQGERILANPKSHAKDIFFEAEVEKLIAIKHSKKRCTCSFVVRWNCHDFKGETEILPLSAIMKKSVLCIDVHPTVAAYFNTLAIPGCKYSSLSTLVEGTKDCQMDALKPETESSDCEMDAFKLEKQIEDISNSATAFGVEVDQHKWQAQNSSTGVQSSISLYPLFVRKELKSSLTPSIKEEEPVNCRTPVNPQAAVAYFALKKSKLSGSTECSSTLKEANVCEISKGGTPYHVSFGSNSTDVDHSLRTEAVIAKYILKNDNIVKKLFLVEESCDDISNTAFSATNDKMKKPICSKRQRSSGISCENVEMTSIMTRRLKRSLVRKAEANTMNKKKPSSFQDTDLLEEEETAVSITDAEIPPTLTENLKCQGGKMELCGEKDPKKRTVSVGRKTSDNTRRLPLSSVHNRKTENNDLEHYKSFEAGRLSEILEGNITSESKASKNEDSIPFCPSQTAGKSTKGQTSPVKIAQKTEGDAPTKQGCGKSAKRKLFTQKNQQLRRSPRLGYLPRTRSQVKVLKI